MLYINQKDYPDIPYITFAKHPEIEKGKHTTVASSACGLCSCMMALDRLQTDYSFSLQDAIQLSYDVEANADEGTDLLIFAPAFADRFNLKYVQSDDIRDLEECLRTGGACVALVANRKDYVSVFTKVDHYIAVISQDKDGVFTILDPAQYEGKYDEPGRTGRVKVDGHFIYVTPELLSKETETCINDRYALFWRK